MAHEPGDVVWLEAHSQVTLVEVARYSGFPEDVLRELMEYGALAPEEPLSAECVGRLREAARLAGDLELDTAAVALVLRFLERIESLEVEVRHLHAQVVVPRR
jgi:chaperone modulatory protein CbpM